MVIDPNGACASGTITSGRGGPSRRSCRWRRRRSGRSGIRWPAPAGDPRSLIESIKAAVAGRSIPLQTFYVHGPARRPGGPTVSARRFRARRAPRDLPRRRGCSPRRDSPARVDGHQPAGCTIGITMGRGRARRRTCPAPRARPWPRRDRRGDRRRRDRGARGVRKVESLFSVTPKTSPAGRRRRGGAPCCWWPCPRA